jgi:ribonuclease Z
MNRRIPFRNIEPSFFSGLLDDPVLHINIRPLGRGLLIDCGRIHHLAKRVLKSLSALFITHAHMDHFMGIDTFIRSVHVSPRTTDIFGPPGIADKLAWKLSGYDWNLTEPYWCTFRVHEVFPDRIETCLFSGPEGFARHRLQVLERHDRVIFRNEYLEVKAEQCDHKIPTLIFRVSELPAFQVDDAKIGREGLVRGDWLRTLQKRFYHPDRAGGPLTVLRWRGEEIVEEPVTDSRALYQSIRGERPDASVGYVTDIGFTARNLETVLAALKGVTLLVCECSFLAEDREKARISAHLCASDVNCLVDRLRPAFVMPMHLSKSYLHHWERLYEELEMPAGVTLLRLPNYLTPRPLLTCEAAKLVSRG